MRAPERSNRGLTRIALVSAILISAILIVLQRGELRESSTFELATQETVAPLAQLLAKPLRGTEAFFGGFEARASVYEKNQALLEELAILRERQARYDNLAFKVARYEAIIGVDNDTNIPLKKIAARAIGETDGPFVRSLLLNVGTRDGVVIGNPVLSTEGLVGHVINAGPNTARVLRLSDLNSRIAVASARSGATAILAGDNLETPKLSFVNQRENWRVGDRVISSGDDGALPRGLEIGIVFQEDTGELRVALSSRAEPIDWVWVSPYKKTTPPLEPNETPMEEAAEDEDAGTSQ
jgi:rod shape-determining protein MreC